MCSHYHNSHYVCVCTLCVVVRQFSPQSIHSSLPQSLQHEYVQGTAVLKIEPCDDVTL